MMRQLLLKVVSRRFVPTYRNQKCRQTFNNILISSALITYLQLSLQSSISVSIVKGCFVYTIMNHNGKSSTKIFQMAGERWKQMLPNEKQPYLEAAKNIKSYKQDQQKKKHTKNRDPTTAEPKKDKEGRQVKNTKKSQRNNKEKKQRRKKQYSTESDSDTVISATSAVSLTSEDLTDPSS
ncbi:uncharacterized protein LOC143175057 isoform X2 [Nomia melanderi]|uniref:uncharacterized protein LOC143175057 isoform X2 n=1 Tax=Nomia melanderi TaxID=2448451 RepID=UPI003FCE9878